MTSSQTWDMSIPWRCKSWSDIIFLKTKTSKFRALLHDPSWKDKSKWGIELVPTSTVCTNERKLRMSNSQANVKNKLFSPKASSEPRTQRIATNWANSRTRTKSKSSLKLFQKVWRRCVTLNRHLLGLQRVWRKEWEESSECAKILVMKQTTMMCSSLIWKTTKR